jgi:hypothetical protein
MVFTGAAAIAKTPKPLVRKSPMAGLAPFGVYCAQKHLGEMFKRTNLGNKGLISADRNNKATLLLTIPRSI